MDSLKTPNQLIYFTNNELNMTLGLSFDKKLRPTMWYREHDDIYTISKIITKNLDKQFPDYIELQKQVIQFCEYDSPCLCAISMNKYTAIITLNTSTEHKATYKLHLYSTVGSNKYEDMGIYYSYFS
jgi:hypothetical protein